jgi:hypothetical protein
MPKGPTGKICPICGSSLKVFASKGGVATTFSCSGSAAIIHGYTDFLYSGETDQDLYVSSYIVIDGSSYSLLISGRKQESSIERFRNTLHGDKFKTLQGDGFKVSGTPTLEQALTPGFLVEYAKDLLNLTLFG